MEIKIRPSTMINMDKSILDTDKPDPRIVEYVYSALGSANTVLNVGA